jgi:hypothetical protein
MKTWKLILPTLTLALGMSQPILAADTASDSGLVAATESVAPGSTSPRLSEAGPNKQSFWGGGLGLVFTSIPISESDFTVLMSELHYSQYLGDPNASMRTAASLGLFGFALILPVPKISMEMYLGKPTQDVQGKVGVGGFYDIAVGGHAGVSAEVGVRLKNRIDATIYVVPAGIDSKRDYLEFMGIRNKTDDNDGSQDGDGIPDYKETPHVKMPYFGFFLSVNY